ncbi:MAG: hypothetical protein KTQ49_01095 [Candidatus Omnitrophica bacterium]|nr:hypothetical protein [Candidatus Omnitrophota bacterium]
MKSRWVIWIMVLAVLFCQGIAFAESTDVVLETVEATAEDAVGIEEEALLEVSQDTAGDAAETEETLSEEFFPAGEDSKDLSAGDDEMIWEDELYIPTEGSAKSDVAPTAADGDLM